MDMAFSGISSGEMPQRSLFGRCVTIVWRTGRPDVRPRARLLGRDWTDHRPYPRDRTGREDGLSGVLSNELFVRRAIDAVDLVIGDVTTATCLPIYVEC